MMQENGKETKVKRIIITAGIAGIVCISLIMAHYHHQGKDDAGGRRLHFLRQEVDTGMLSVGLEDTGSSGQEGMPDGQNQKQPELTYIGLETVRSLLGEDRYLEFRNRFETFLKTNSSDECSMAALATPDIVSDQEQVSGYLQTDDKDKKIYQFIYRYSDDSYSFMEVDMLPDNTQDRIGAGSLTQSGSAVQATGAEQDAAAGQDAGTGQEDNGNSTAASTGAVASSSTDDTACHTVNGVQFENLKIYEVLSQKAVDLFTKDVTRHWESCGEERRLIRTTKPEKNGSKVTFTCTFTDGGDSFEVTLDLNRETFSYE